MDPRDRREEADARAGRAPSPLLTTRWGLLLLAPPQAVKSLSPAGGADLQVLVGLGELLPVVPSMGALEAGAAAPGRWKSRR